MQNGSRPKLLAEEVFRGTNGYLGLELWGKDKALSGSVLPQFFTRAGEEIEVPAAFVPATKALAAAVNCVGCTSAHYLSPAVPEVQVQPLERAEKLDPALAVNAG